MKKDFRTVKEAFITRGFTLLDSYTNKSTLMKYICRCGREAFISYENVVRNKVGCGLCSREKWPETFHKAMKEKYGVEHSAQNPESFRKQQESSYKLKKYIFPSGKIGEIQGYEHLCLNELLYERKIDEDDIVVGFDQVPIIKYIFMNENRYYYPDIYIKSQNKIIEVKSDYTYNLAPDRNELKWAAVVEQGYKMDCFIYDKKKRLIEKRSYSPGLCLRFIEDIL